MKGGEEEGTGKAFVTAWPNRKSKYVDRTTLTLVISVNEGYRVSN